MIHPLCPLHASYKEYDLIVPVYISAIHVHDRRSIVVHPVIKTYFPERCEGITRAEIAATTRP